MRTNVAFDIRELSIYGVCHAPFNALQTSLKNYNTLCKVYTGKKIRVFGEVVHKLDNYRILMN